MHQNKRIVKRSTFYAIMGVILFVISFSSAWACSVPVFRYALERWRADTYEAVVFHGGELNPESEKLVEQLRHASVSRETAADVANIEVRLVDLGGDMSSDDQTLFDEISADGETRLAILSPKLRLEDKRKLIWSAPFNAENVNKFLDSPGRREIARRLLGGQSAVWVLLEGENNEENDKASQLLEQRLSHLELTQELPEIDEQDVTDGLLTLDPNALKIKYSFVRINKADPAEQFFVNTLLESEGDLRDPEFADQPMAFPVFGRGRVLYALIGGGINDEMIDEACHFLAGSCSCEVKDQNPGTDLMMSVNWEMLIQPTIEIDNELPPLAGLGQFVKASALEESSDAKTPAIPAETADVKDVEANENSVAATPADEAGSTTVAAATNVNDDNERLSHAASDLPANGDLMRNVLIAVGLGVLSVVIGGFWVMSRSGKQS